MHTSPPFSIVSPRTVRPSPVIVEIPHAGLAVPATCLATLAIPASSIGRDADLYVDELYADAPLEGATMLVAHMSRYVVDLNRAEDDVDSDAVEGGRPGGRSSRGVVWRLSSDGARVLTRKLTQIELEERLAAVYRPYHRALSTLIEERRREFGFVVVLAAHSMPSTGRAGHGDPSQRRADVVPGTRGRTSAAASLIDAVERHALATGLSVRHDDPYRGGHTTQHYGRPHDGVHVVQVELARRLYMNETTLARSAELGRTRAFCRALVATLVETAVR